MFEPSCTTANLHPGMRFQSTAPGYEHVVCTFMGAAATFFASDVRAGSWRYVGDDKGSHPRAAYHAHQLGERRAASTLQQTRHEPQIQRRRSSG